MFSCDPGASDIAFIRVTPFRAVSALLAAAIGVLPFAPAEHVHETTAPDGHHELIGHRHAPAHALHPYYRVDLHDPTVDDHDGVVLRLDAVFTAPRTQVPAVPHQALVATIQEPIAVEHANSQDFIHRPIHRPPRAPTPLRGPPSSLL
jgi:hypothetical protein